MPQLLSFSLLTFVQLLFEGGYYQGRIKPPKEAKGHATYVDRKMLSVTKYNFQRDSASAMTQVQLCNSRAAGMANILSAPFAFEDFLTTEGILAIENDRVSHRE